MKNKNINETIKLIDMEYDNISWNPEEFYSNGFKPVENLSQLPSALWDRFRMPKPMPTSTMTRMSNSHFSLDEI